MLKNNPKLNACRGKKSLNNKYLQVLTFRYYITFIFKILKSSSKVYVLIWIQQLKKQFFGKFVLMPDNRFGINLKSLPMYSLLMAQSISLNPNQL